MLRFCWKHPKQWKMMLGSLSILGAAGKWRGTPNVLSSIYPSFWTRRDLGVAPAVSAVASRNWHWGHCLQRGSHGWGLKVHSWDQNAVWNTNSLCAPTTLCLRLPHPHPARSAELPPLPRVSTCGLSFYSHSYIHKHKREHKYTRISVILMLWWRLISELWNRSCKVQAPPPPPTYFHLVKRKNKNVENADFCLFIDILLVNKRCVVFKL